MIGGDTQRALDLDTVRPDGVPPTLALNLAASISFAHPLARSETRSNPLRTEFPEQKGLAHPRSLEARSSLGQRPTLERVSPSHMQFRQYSGF